MSANYLQLHDQIPLYLGIPLAGMCIALIVLVAVLIIGGIMDWIDR